MIADKLPLASEKPSLPRAPSTLKLRQPYLLFLGDAENEPIAKTAFGVRDWAANASLAQWRLPGCEVDLALPDMTPEMAAAAGAGSLLIGIAPPGGSIPRSWEPLLLRAVEAGLDIVSGMHVASAVAMFLFVWLIGPICEEVMYRGLLWGALERLKWGRWAVFCLTTVIFAVSHLEPLRTTLLLVIGIPIGLARLFTGRLGASIIAHQVNNFLPAVAVLLVALGAMPA